MVPGSNVFAVAGVPPGKLQLYVGASELGAQGSTNAIGLTDSDPQAFGMLLMATAGGCLTSMVWEIEFIPQEFVVVNVNV